mmetsp:Transcript_3069/g.9355  ORF Transcript_3069/g.9355 Transcript_3069/m.9355 type:complete len:203 (-) Transcript_3069:36-644(-)
MSQEGRSALMTESLVFEVEVGVAVVLVVEAGDPAVDDVRGQNEDFAGPSRGQERIRFGDRGLREAGHVVEEVLRYLAREGSSVVDAAARQVEVPDGVGRFERNSQLDSAVRRDLRVPGRAKDAARLVRRHGAQHRPAHAVEGVVQHGARLRRQRRARHEKEAHFVDLARIHHRRRHGLGALHLLELRDRRPARDHHAEGGHT